jgi:hypothetical protein
MDHGGIALYLFDNDRISRAFLGILPLVFGISTRPNE